MRPNPFKCSGKVGVDMRAVYLVRWEKVCEVSDSVAEELLSLPTSQTTVPVYLDGEDYQQLSQLAQKELKQLKKFMRDGEVLELVVVPK